MDEFSYAVSCVEKLADRRQSTTSFYLSVNTGVLAVIGLLLKDSGLGGWWWAASVLMLMVAGFVACWIWRSLIQQDRERLDWWWARLRELEAEKPKQLQLVTREYKDLYEKRKGFSTTGRVLALNYTFSALYVTFAIGVLAYWLI